MKLRVGGLVAMVLTIGLETASGQAFTGTITGAVSDPNGAAVPNATVRVRNEATGDARSGTSGNDGLYIFSQLPPGMYEVSAEAPGFRRTVQTGAELRVDQTLEMNLNLQIGEVSQTIEVQASVTMLTRSQRTAPSRWTRRRCWICR